MYKVVMIDLDGTLLDDNKNVSSKNIEMINKVYREKNILFVITTGKSIYDIKYIIDAIGEAINKYIIASNGAIIKDNVKNEYIVKNYLTDDEVKNILDECKKYDLKSLIQTEYGMVVEDKLSAEVENAIYADDLKQYIFDNNVSNIALITPNGTKENLELLKRKINNNFTTLESTEVCNYTHNNNGKTYTTKYIDVMKKGSTKANAIKILIDYLNISKEEVIAIGDGGNDIPMFEMAGYKVAMENASEKLKEKADYVTSSNNEDGVAKALEHILYKGEF